jgi:hypothetical protein
MKPSLYLFKKDISRTIEKSRTIENPRTQVHFVIVDSDTSKDYPLNFVCVLPQGKGVVNRHTIFRRIFGEESVPLARKLLSKALTKESDLEIKTEVGKRLKTIAQKNIAKSK